MNSPVRCGIADSPLLRERLALLGLPEAWLAEQADISDSPPGGVQAVLEWQQDRLQLRPLDKTLGSPVAVDFLHGKTGFRMQRFAHEMVVKAVMGRRQEPLKVVDATAGLGRDGFLLAAAGMQVTLIERHPLIATLLADGLYRAAQDVDAAAICQRTGLLTGPAQDILRQMADHDRPDVIYLDPMFPERQKSALVKKEMRIFRELVGDDEDAESLLALALQIARKRVVVKRPRKADAIGNHKPGHQLVGTNSRFDVYPLG